MSAKIKDGISIRFEFFKKARVIAILPLSPPDSFRSFTPITVGGHRVIFPYNLYL